jgi:hypothetical protein
MNALGSTAFNPELSPYTLTQAAAQLEPIQPEDAELMHSFAADLAAIQELPEQKLDNGLNPVWKDYS